MLTFDIFKKRATELWNSQKAMAAPKKFKSGRRAGMVRKPAAPITFTKDDLMRWLWEKVGLNAIQCRYCNAPIDILSLTLDHIMPRSAGGEFSLENMQCICTDDNARKGNLSHEGYLALLRLARTELSPYDQGILLSRLKAAHHGSPARFFRKPADPKQATPPPQQSGIDFDLPTF
jgi:5-methylcytosine-specific restriction endonuclease McrA